MADTKVRKRRTRSKRWLILIKSVFEILNVFWLCSFAGHFIFIHVWDVYQIAKWPKLLQNKKLTIFKKEDSPNPFLDTHLKYHEI